MPRIHTLPTRYLSASALTTAAEAAGFALAGFQDAGANPEPRRASSRGLRLAVVLLPMMMALAALGVVALNI